MTLVLLDTNIYLRLAKRIRPMLGVKFGQREYVITILKDVEDEVHRSGNLRFKFPWFDDADLVAERAATQMRLSRAEHKTLDVAHDVIFRSAIEDVERYISQGCHPPSSVDCRVLAFGQIRPSIVVTDDLGMHLIAADLKIKVWHGPELLAKMLTAKMVQNNLIREIYAALEANGDTTRTWHEAKHTTFSKIFGRLPAKHN